MPDSLAGQHGKYLLIPGVRFGYGNEQVLAGLGEQCRLRSVSARARGEGAAATSLGQPISYRFKRDGKGWAGVREHPDDGRAGGYGRKNAAPSAWI